MRVILAGSRDFSDYEEFKKGINESGFDITEVISGGARGADTLGEKYAKEMNLSLRIFLAKWNEFGKSAGFIRNEEMSNNADALIAFWDQKSQGTKNMIDIAKNKGLKVHVHKYQKEPTGNPLWNNAF